MAEFKPFALFLVPPDTDEIGPETKGKGELNALSVAAE
eukprot:CAMPEP_0113306598 /NCGR_PEP_ID=MMETSP0010_2-20120614/5786_1 /TAXON_ID=216773 ORGANISM="Corethron hystrix, Strain 308" /NCGR_SAMPLE_ID=MMETSP0010_2 /ASSEMBLY_ACC=CAM_ASM_000155 /LENGTH=37 /DNA_ID=CAMNT_0000161299 /DNA_START=145 /DNA_END=261 /DNA_ORIENTATION=+ /assembly_acc=CAM_ASM_000155